MDTIFLVSPNTEKDRLKQIIKSTSGFLYMVAVFGTTGVQTKIHRYTIDALKNTKIAAKGKIPVGVGFGISTEKDVQKYVSSGADAVIVGSANIKIIEIFYSLLPPFYIHFSCTFIFYIFIIFPLFFF